VLRDEKEKSMVLVAACWGVFSAAATADVFEDICLRCGQWTHSSDMTCRQRLHVMFSMLNLFHFAGHSLAIYLIVATQIDVDCDSQKECQLPMGLMQFVAWFKFLLQLRSNATIGYVLIPILDAMSTTSMRGMTCIIFFMLLALFSSFSAVMREYDLKQMFLRTYYVLVIGEPDLFDFHNYNDPSWQYISVYVAFFGFTIVLMNVFIAITSESYRSRSTLVEGLFLVERRGLCEKAFILRKMLFHRAKQLRIPRRIVWMALVFFILCGAMLLAWFHTEDEHKRYCVLFSFPMLALICECKLLAIFWRRPVAKHDNKYYLWVCTPQAVKDPSDQHIRKLKKLNTTMRAYGAKSKEQGDRVVGEVSKLQEKQEQYLQDSVSQIQLNQAQLQNQMHDVLSTLRRLEKAHTDSRPAPPPPPSVPPLQEAVEVQLRPSVPPLPPLAPPTEVPPPLQLNMTWPRDSPRVIPEAPSTDPPLMPPRPPSPERLEQTLPPAFKFILPTANSDVKREAQPPLPPPLAPPPPLSPRIPFLNSSRSA
jgi:hypothetical protein